MGEGNRAELERGGGTDRKGLEGQFIQGEEGEHNSVRSHLHLTNRRDLSLLEGKRKLGSSTSTLQALQGKMVGSRSLFALSEPVAMDGNIASDLQTILAATASLGTHVYSNVGNAFSNGSLLTWLAVGAAVYLFVIDRTNWRTNILTALLVPYIGLNMPGILLRILRGDIGLWLAFIAVVLRLFFPKNFPEHAELPACLILLVVTAPKVLVGIRFTWIGELISVAIGFYLLYDHVNNAGGFRKAFTERGVPITFGIILLFVAPCWQFFL